MKREIKFRARWRDTGKVIPDFQDEYMLDAINDDVFIVDQFTGLKDKNGVEIYEGDILKTGTDKAMLVSWNEKMASFSLSREDWSFTHWFGESCDPGDCVVIGNIHDHPELLVNRMQEGETKHLKKEEMKTAEEVLDKIYKEKTKAISSISTDRFPKAYSDIAIEAMKEYAKEVAGLELSKAAQKLTKMPLTDLWVIQNRRDLISTEIITP